MDDVNDVTEAAGTPEAPTEAPLEPAPPITSRFLFVDVAALRAKQLRRGARPRLEGVQTPVPQPPNKAERLAMEEVRRGLVQYQLPEPKAAQAEEQE